MQSLLFVFNYPPVGNNNWSFPYAYFGARLKLLIISTFLASLNQGLFFPLVPSLCSLRVNSALFHY